MKQAREHDIETCFKKNNTKKRHLLVKNLTKESLEPSKTKQKNESFSVDKMITIRSFIIMKLKDIAQYKKSTKFKRRRLKRALITHQKNKFKLEEKPRFMS